MNTFLRSIIITIIYFLTISNLHFDIDAFSTIISKNINDVNDFVLEKPLNINEVNVNQLFQGKHIQTTKEVMSAINVLKKSHKIIDKTSANHILEYMISNSIEINTRVFNNLLDGLTKFSTLECEKLLNQMKEMQISRDSRTYGAIINSYYYHNMHDKAINLIKTMYVLDLVVPDVYCYTTALKSCLKSNRAMDSLDLIDDLERNNVTGDSYIYNAALQACASNGQWDWSLKLFNSIRNKNITLDSYAYSAMLTTLANNNQTTHMLNIINEISLERQNDQSYVFSYNIVITALMKLQLYEKAFNVHKIMTNSNIKPTLVTYTALFTGLIKFNCYNEILKLFYEIIQNKVERNAAIYGVTMTAVEKLGEWKLAITLLQSMRKDNIIATTVMYNSAIAVCGKQNQFDECKQLLIDMKLNNVSRSLTTYNLLIGACKPQGKWRFAVKYLNDIRKDNNTDLNGVILSGGSKLEPNTATYTMTISTCVEAKEWGLALELLTEMEELDIPRTSVTYHSVIEALDAADETVRAELVYQSALRTGIFNHWLISKSIYKPINKNNDNIMDLHKFPTAVAKVAIMHVLGEMCSNQTKLADPLIIIVGRGNHVNSNGKRGILREEIEKFLTILGLTESVIQISNSNNLINPGRIIISKNTIEKWLQYQIEDNKIKRNEGSVHGNLFLRVAFAKHLKADEMNVRATCPFSTATVPTA